MALFDGGTGSDRVPRDGVPASNTQRSGGLCGSLKSLLMSSSYRVRAATSQLITTLCSSGGDQHLACNANGAHKYVNCSAGRTGGAGGAGGAADGDITQRSLLLGSFFRERLIAAGVTGLYLC